MTATAREVALEARREEEAQRRLAEAQRLADAQAEHQRILAEAIDQASAAPCYGWFPGVTWEAVKVRGDLLLVRSVDNDPLYLQINLRTLDAYMPSLRAEDLEDIDIRAVHVESAAAIGAILNQRANPPREAMPA